MATNDSRQTAAVPSGLKTPSPTKSRLPLGSTLPKRSTSVKGLPDISLPPPTRQSSLRVPGTARKSTHLQSSLLPAPSRVENQRPTRPGRNRGNPSVATSSDGHRSKVGESSIISTIKETSNTPAQLSGYSRPVLEDRLELLHLHVLHSKSSEAQTQWETSAFQCYQKQFIDLQNRHRELHRLEAEQTIQRNAAALLSWPKPGCSLSQQIQSLSKVTTEVDQLNSPNGRYTLAIQAFEHWVTTAAVPSTRQARDLIQAKTKVVEGLGDGWLMEIEALQSQVVALADQMLALEVSQPSGSDLERIISTVTEMLGNMLEELEAIMDLESTLKQDGKDQADGSISIMAEELDKVLRLK